MDVAGVLVIIGLGFLLFLPAMVPNSAAAMFGGGRPIDGGRTWNGKRILGDGKTWRGLIGGVFSGILIGLIILLIAFACGDKNYFGYGPFWTNVGVIVCLALGSLLGDMLGAFIKRRIGMDRGQKAPILDQYDFVIGAFVLTAIFFPNFVYANYIEGWHIAALIFIILIMFFLHRIVNIVGYLIGVKKEPW